MMAIPNNNVEKGARDLISRSVYNGALLILPAISNFRARHGESIDSPDIVDPPIWLIGRNLPAYLPFARFLKLIEFGLNNADLCQYRIED
jgi:hypothetical protein